MFDRNLSGRVLRNFNARPICPGTPHMVIMPAYDNFLDLLFIITPVQFTGRATDLVLAVVCRLPCLLVDQLMLHNINISGWVRVFGFPVLPSDGSSSSPSDGAGNLSRRVSAESPWSGSGMTVCQVGTWRDVGVTSRPPMHDVIRNVTGWRIHWAKW